MTDTQDNRPEDDDVEGHRLPRKADAETSGDDDVEGHKKNAKADAETSDDDDVEGHLKRR